MCARSSCSHFLTHPVWKPRACVESSLCSYRGGGCLSLLVLLQCRRPRELGLTLRPVCVAAGLDQQPPQESDPEIIVDGSLIRILQFKKRNEVY